VDDAQSSRSHLCAKHPDLLQEPAVPPLAELMRLVRVRMAHGN